MYQFYMHSNILNPKFWAWNPPIFLSAKSFKAVLEIVALPVIFTGI